jgi:hypothetical protein
VWGGVVTREADSRFVLDVDGRDHVWGTAQGQGQCHAWALQLALHNHLSAGREVFRGVQVDVTFDRAKCPPKQSPRETPLTSSPSGLSLNPPETESRC